MKAVLKIEFQRLFRSVTFYISLGIGLILTMTQFVMVGLQESMHILDAYSPKGISEPYGVFSSYFGMAGPPLVYLCRWAAWALAGCCLRWPGLQAGCF